MAKLTPDSTYIINGVTVNTKIIPDGTRWKNDAKAKAAGFEGVGALYKKERKLTNNTGKPKTVTIHNTNDLDNVEDDGEQYVRATYNENMNSVRVHFYVDDICAWQEMRAGTGMCKDDPDGAAEVSWHSGDGSVTDGGNMTSISMEIIMNDNAEHDAKAYDNGARIAAWLLFKHGLTINDVVSHTYWVNKSAGKKFSNVDDQCTSPISGKKWCPTYIFKSSDKAKAKANWLAFKAVIGKYLNELKAGQKTETVVPSENKADGVTYCVQVGSFKNIDNAKAMSAKLTAAGFENYITEKGGSGSASVQTPEKPKEEKQPEKKIVVGSHVKVKADAKVYGKTYKLAFWVYNDTWVVRSISGKRVVIDKNVAGTHSICSPVSIDDLTVV